MKILKRKSEKHEVRKLQELLNENDKVYIYLKNKEIGKQLNTLNEIETLYNII